MYFTDPFQFSAAGYRLAGMMVEQQMRVMLALTDATFGGKNPFVSPPVLRRDTAGAEATKTADAPKAQIARVVKARVTPQDLKLRREAKPSVTPPARMHTEGLHPAE